MLFVWEIISKMWMNEISHRNTTFSNIIMDYCQLEERSPKLPQEKYIRDTSSREKEIVLSKNKNFTQNLKYLEVFLFWHLNWLGHAKMCLKNQLLEKKYTIT